MTVTHNEVMLAKSFLPVASMLLNSVTALSQTVFDGLFQYSHLLLKNVKSNGQISSKVTSCISNLFSMSGLETRKPHFHVMSTSHAGIWRRLELGCLGLNEIRLGNQFARTS